MADLEFQGGVDFSDGLTSLDTFAESVASQLEAAFSTSLESFAAQLAAASDVPPIELTADASQIPVEAEAAVAGTQLELPLEVDSTTASAEIQDLVSGIEGTAATIEVDADTTNAQAAADELGDSLSSAGTKAAGSRGSVESWGEGAAVAGGSAALARGEIGGLSEVVTGAGLSSAAAVGGVAALGASVFELAQRGIEAVSAEERFNLVVGESADAVEKVHVGTLTADLEKLGLQFGSTDAEVKNSAAGLFQFATNSGASSDEAAKFTTEVAALSARAISLNPNLGNLSDVADSLGVRLARGGRFAAAYGLSLTAAEISARALSNTSKTDAADLTIYEKAAAAAQIATERYGDTLGDVVAKGAKNAANEQKSLRAEVSQLLEEAGKPLVAPFLEAFRAALPDLIAIARPLAEIGVSILPAVATAASIVAPPLRLIADVIHDTPAPLLTAVAAYVLLNSILGTIGGKLAATAAEQTAVAASAETMAVAEGEAAASTGLAAGAGTALTASTVGLGQAVLVAGVGIAAYTLTTKALHAIFDDNFLNQVESAFEKLDARTKQVANTTGSELLPRFRELVSDTIRVKNAANEAADVFGEDFRVAVGSKAVESLVAFKKIAGENYDTAVLLVAQMRQAGIDTSGYDRILQQLAPHQRENASATQAANDQVTLLTGSYEDQIGVLDREITALESLYDKGFAAIHAQEAQTDAVNEYVIAAVAAAEAGGDNAKANDELQRALVRAEEASLRNAEAARQKAEADHQAEGAVAAHKAGVEAEIGVLQGLTSTLDPGNPLRQFLEQYIARLLATAGDFDATVRILGIDAALQQLGLVGDALEAVKSGASPAIGVFPGGAAEGAYVPARAGGTLLTVGEGGSDEAVVSPANIPGAIASLSRLGILDKLAVYRPGSGATVMDYSVRVGQIITPSAERVPAVIAGKQRAAQFLAGR